MNNENDPIRNIRDYTLPNGYAYAAIDEGRALRGFLAELFKFVVVMFKLVFFVGRRLFRSR